MACKTPPPRTPVPRPIQPFTLKPKRTPTKADIPPWIQKIGPKYVELAKLWVPSAFFFTATAAVAGLYYTDWKVVVQYIPYYGVKFRPPPPPPPPNCCPPCPPDA